MELILSNTIRVTDPTKEQIAWCKKNLVLANPEYAKKMRMHFWVGNTPKTLNLYETHGNDLILPFGVLRDLPDYFFAGNISNDFGGGISVDYGKPVPLYPYQEVAVDTVKNAQFGILQSPAGSGKTQMGIALVKEFGKRALWLTHTSDLLRQSKARAEQYMDKSLIGTITEGKVNIGTGITFATVQTMSHMDLTQYKHMWDVIIVDECHRVARTANSVGLFYKILNNLSARHKIGLSATVHRSDGMIEAVYAVLGRVVYTVPQAAVGDKIMQVSIQPVDTGVRISRECLNTDGTMNYTKLITYLCEHADRNQLIAYGIVENRDHSCLILSDRLGHLESIMNMLPEDMRKQSVMVSGKMTTKKGKAEREQAISDMKCGKKKYLFATYSLAKEGLDIPCLDRLFMATPQKDYAVIVQSIGRIARTDGGKGEPICYDFVDNIQFLVKSYKKRLSTYRKQNCKILGD